MQSRSQCISCLQDYETERTYIETVTLQEVCAYYMVPPASLARHHISSTALKCAACQAILASRMDFTTLGMIMQTIGLFYDAARQREVSHDLLMARWHTISPTAVTLESLNLVLNLVLNI